MHDKLPDDIIKKLTALRDHGRQLSLIECRVIDSDLSQWVVGLVDQHSNFQALAVIPTMHILDYVEHYDRLVKTAGGPETDPEYKGVKQ